MKKVTLILVFLTVLAGIAGFYVYQKNIYSKDILKLEILGPDSSDLLGEVEYTVKYKNNGDTRLDEPQLTFEYPQYSLPSDGNSQIVTKTSADLGGAIYPGQEQAFTFKARLIGKEGETKTAKASLIFQPRNLKARFESNTTFTTVINKSPLTFEFDSPSAIDPGKDFSLRLNYFSNLEQALQNLRITMEYPSDFEFVDSNPKSLEKNSWEIGLLNKGEGGRIEVSGRLSGGIGEDKIFRAKIGIVQNDEFILLKEAEKGISIAKPALIITQQINNNPDFIASPSSQLHYEIFFKNVGDTPLTNLFLVSQLEGAAFDLQSIRSNNGDFSSGDNSIVFDWKKVPDLQFLDAGQEGKVEFWIKLKDASGIPAGAGSPTIKNSVSLNQISEEFVTKISSRPQFSQKGYFRDDVFGNSGPLPPRVGETTTYTVAWNVKNYFSGIKNATARAVLPSQVKLSGKISPASESDKLAFDSQSRELVWNIGDLAANETRNIIFQIALAPVSSQKGSQASLIGQVSFAGQDQEAGALVESSSSGVSTNSLDDPTITDEMGIVQ